jgi:predicted transcriptional regulator
MAAKHRARGRPRLTQTERVLRAVARGAQDAKTISRQARVPLLHVHPLLNRLRARGEIVGYTGNVHVPRAKTKKARPTES